MFVACLVITFVMVCSCRLMSVSGHFVKFGGSLVRILGHDASFRVWALLRAEFVYSSIEDQPATII